MKEKRFNDIRETVRFHKVVAEKILGGDENYDGADGARYVLELCEICEELMESYLTDTVDLDE